MAIFLDSHLGPELPVEAIRDFLRGARARTADAYGVTPLDLYCGADNRVFCVVSAPDEAAIRQAHAAQGVICRRVRRVQGDATDGQLTTEEKAVVRQMVVADEGWSELYGDDSDSLRQVG